MYSTVFAQYITPNTVIDGSTGNLVYTTVNPPPPGADPISWTGFSNTTSTGGGYSGGYVPGYNPNTGTFMFGYVQRTIAYSTPVNYALSVAGTNIQVNGFRYSWEYYNQGDYRGTLTGNINLTNKSGQIVENYNYNMPQTTSGWTTFNGTQNFATQYAATTLDRLNVSFSGKDDRFWAGYYGPQIRDIDVSLLYSVTPVPVPTDFARWVPLANENDSFTLNTAGVVRYGANGTYVYHEFQPGTYSCTNSAWGIDPISGVYKSCSFGTNTIPTPTIPKVTTTDTYTSGVAVLEPAAAVVLDPVVTTNSPTSSTSNTSIDMSTPTVSSTPQQTVVNAVVSAPAPAVSSTPTSSVTSSTAGTTTTQTTAKESSSSGGNNVGLALSIISKNSERDAAGSAIAQAAVLQAQQAAATAQTEASSVAANAVSNSVSAGQSALKTDSNNSSTNKSSSSNNGFEYSVQTPTQLNATTSTKNITSNTTTQKTEQLVGVSITVTPTVQSNNNLETSQPLPVNSTVNNTVSSAVSTNTSVLPPIAPQTQIVLQANIPVQNTAQTQVQTEQQIQQVTYVLTPPQTAVLQTYVAPVTLAEIYQQSQQAQQNQNTQVESYAVLNPSTLTDKTNPINDIIDNKQSVPQNSTATVSGPAVNKNVQDNEAAGGVNINKMALAPVGYVSYLNFTLKDAAFYIPKEVYKNQKNVDNARVLRQLTNDSRHQQMVEQQYRR